MSTSLPLLFLLGLLSSLSPCFYPLFPTLLAYVANVENDLRRGAAAGLTCTLGVTLSFALYGLLASLLAAPLLMYGSALRYAFGLCIITLGVATLTPMKKAFARLRPPAQTLRVKGYLGSFILGFSYTLIAAPCAMPIFLSAVILATAAGNVVITVLNLTVFALGAALPFVLSSLLVAAARDYVGKRYQQLASHFDYVSASTLILTGLLLLLPAFGLPSIL